MSNETDLDWLARNVHVWKSGYDLAVVQRGGGEIYVTWPSVCSGGITKKQWLARRAELQNKPSWRDAPEWAHWLAQHESGVWCWGNATPERQCHGVVGVWDSVLVDGKNHAEDSRCEWSGCAGEVLGDWRDTLERRP